MILILTNLREDAHIGPVAAELGRRGRDFIIFNPGAYPSTATITVDGTSEGVAARMAWNGTTLDLSRVRSVWYRRPEDFRLADGLRPEEDKWLRSECAHLIRGLWANMPARWVSAPHAIRQASLKLLQLRLAAELGFRIPRFTVTNDVDRAAHFLTECPEGVIVKALAEPVIATQKQATTLYTHLVTKHDAEQLDAVRHGPTFLQQFVVKAMDVRVTVIGETVFAAGIESSGDRAGRIDFRSAEVFDLPHRCLELPAFVKAACLALVRRLDLYFGAIDLLLTPDGEYEFLEINPNGQWAWIEMITGMPMTKAMCDVLTEVEDGGRPG